MARNKIRRRLKNRRAGKRRAYRGKLGRIVTPAGMLSVAKTSILGTIAPTGGGLGPGEGKGAGDFRLSANSDLIALSAQFDQYRICAAQIKVMPLSSEASAGGAQNLGLIYTYIDYTDANGAENVQEVLDRQKYQLHRATNPWTEYIKGPRTATPVYNGVVVSGYEVNGPNKWLSTKNTAVPHYGWKWFCTNMQNQFATVYIKVYVQFKDPL